MTLYHPVEPLAQHHNVDDFACGHESMDKWLRKRASSNEASGSSRTFVTTDDGAAVAGYYSLAAGAVVRADLPGKMRRNAPDPLPVLVLGRLAVDLDHAGHGLGKGLAADALVRAARASSSVGFVAVVVHPVDDTAHDWWMRRGFLEAPTTEPMLYMPLAAVIEHATG